MLQMRDYTSKSSMVAHIGQMAFEESKRDKWKINDEQRYAFETFLVWQEQIFFSLLKLIYTWKTVKSMGKCKVFMGVAVVLSCIMFLYGLISGDTEYVCGQNLDCPSLYLRRVSRCTVGSTYYCCDEDCWYYKTKAACGDDCCSALNNTTVYCDHLWWTASKITLVGVAFMLFCYICYFLFSCLASCCCRQGVSNYTSPSVDTSAENYIKWQKDYNESLASSNKRMFQENSRRMNGSNW